MGNEPTVYDALIIGAGPAGVTCATWLAHLGLRPILLDAQSHVGGLCWGNPFPDPWTVLVPEANGEAIAERLATSVANAGIDLRLDTLVQKIDMHCGSGEHGARQFTAHCNGDAAVHGRCVVLATGVRPRGRDLAVDSAGRPAPGVIVGPGGDVARQNYVGKRVAILGGGDNAFENALYVKKRGAAEIDLYARTVRSQQQLQERVPREWVSQGPYTVDVSARRVNGRSYDLILVFYGWEPAAMLAHGLSLDVDEFGFVETQPHTAQTSVEGVYAVGELTRRQHPCVVTAMADGVVAAKAVQAKLERRDTY